MSSNVKVYVHPRGDAARYVHLPSSDGKVLAGVSIGSVSIQSADPEYLEQVASELLEAAHEQRAAAHANADRDGMIDALRASAFTTTEGRTIIHTLRGGFGADWDLESAIEFVRDAEEAHWIDHLTGHDLAAVRDGRTVCFDVKRPAVMPA